MFTMICLKVCLHALCASCGKHLCIGSFFVLPVVHSLFDYHVQMFIVIVQRMLNQWWHALKWSNLQIRTSNKFSLKRRGKLKLLFLIYLFICFDFLFSSVTRLKVSTISYYDFYFNLFMFNVGLQTTKCTCYDYVGEQSIVNMCMGFEQEDWLDLH
jgi:hypothetical protein